MRILRLMMANAFAVALTGCATGLLTYAPPQPWERGVLARPDMQFDDDKLAARNNQHIYTSKEAATGGYGVGGGGCGCN